MIIEQLITFGKMMQKEWSLITSKTHVNFGQSPTRNKSISSLANDSTYFYPVVGSEYLSADELVMLTRAFERSYAVFTRTAFSLIPAVEVPSFTNATVRNYLTQFHTNMNTVPNWGGTIDKNNGFTLNETSLNEASTGGPDPIGGPLGPIETNVKRAEPFKKATTLFSDLDWKKANDMLPTTMQVPVKFVSRDTKAEAVVDVMVNIKATMHRSASSPLVQDIANSVNGKRGLLNFVKWFSGEQKSLSDLLFGVSQMKFDIQNKKASPWVEAFKRRARLAQGGSAMLMNNLKPIATLCVTMNEVNALKTQYDIDVFKDVKKIMDAYYLLGFCIVDQVNEVVYVRYDSQVDFQEFPYKTLEREAASQDRTLKDMVKAMGALR
jgi:hypothetical protein